MSSSSSSLSVSPSDVTHIHICDPVRASPLIQLFQHHSNQLLANCIRFLDQRERIQTAQCSHYLFEVCCSPSSWSCGDDVAASLFDFARCRMLRRQRSETKVKFNAPTIVTFAVHLKFIPHSRLFAHARCMEICWRSDIPFDAELPHLNEMKSLQHLYFTNTSVYGAMKDSSRIKLPSTLKSFSFELDSSTADDCRQLLPLLPSTLHTLQIVKSNLVYTPNMDLDFKQALKRLTQLQRFVFLWTVNSPRHEFSIDSFGLTSSHIGNLDFYCDMCPGPALREISQNSRLELHSPPAVLCATVSHLHIPSVHFFHECSRDFNWSAALLILNSLFIAKLTLFKEKPNLYPERLPEGLGERIKSTVVFKVDEDPDVSNDDCAARDYSHCLLSSGLANLTSLTFDCYFKPRHGIFNGLANLTYLSCSVQRNGKQDLNDFNEFAPLRSLRTLKIDAWPLSYLLLDPHSRCLTWREIDQTIRECKEGKMAIVATDEPEAPVQSLAEVFPSLTELVIVRRESLPISCFEARPYLNTIPNLRSIVWGNELPLHPSQIDFHYTIQAIKERSLQEAGISFERGRRDIKDKTEYKSETSYTLSDTDAGSLTCETAHNFDSRLLSLLFQYLFPQELGFALEVNKHWYLTAANPQLWQHPIAIKILRMGGVSVHGPLLSLCADHLTHERTIVRAARSRIFRNMPILQLSCHDQNHERIPRESCFANQYLRTFAHVPHFNRLQALSLDWTIDHIPFPSSPAKVGGIETRIASFYPTAADLEQIRQVFLSPALQDLLVFEMKAPAFLIYIMLPFLTHLKQLEVVRLHYLENSMGLSFDEQCKARELDSLTHLMSLKKAIVFQENIYNAESGCKEVPPVQLFQAVCNMAPPAFEELIWRGVLPESTLQDIADSYRDDDSNILPRLKSLSIGELEHSLNSVSDAFVAIPDLCELSISCIVLGESEAETPARPLPAQLSAQLTTLKLELFVSGRPKGPLTVSFMQTIVDSNLRQLERFLIYRNFLPAKSDAVSEDRICDQLQTIIDNNPRLLELEVANFDLKLSCWERILPKLHVVHSHRAMLPLIDMCTQLRQLWEDLDPTPNDILNDLLRLPNFEAVIRPRETTMDVIFSRSRIMEEKEYWDQAEIDLAAAQRQSELHLIRANPDSYYLRSGFGATAKK